MSVDESILNATRNLRSKETWVRYDSCVIGAGARDVDPAWFNTWAQFAAAESVLFNSGQRSANVGLAYTNQTGEREDYGQRIYQSGIEFIAPPGILEFEEDNTDALLMPLVFTRELPNRSSFRVEIANTDTVAIIPGVHFPAAVGTPGASTDDSSSDVTLGASNGKVDLRSSWIWPAALDVPAKSQFHVRMRLDQPWRNTLLALVNSPKNKQIPIPPAVVGDPPVGTIACPNWYVIRVWHRGPRYVQLRGARSS